MRDKGANDAVSEALLIDLGGVIYQSEERIDGAAEAVVWLEERCVPHLFLTNTTSRSRAALVRKLERMGVTAGEEKILSPAVAAAAWLRRHDARRLALYVPEDTKQEFAAFDETDDESADAVVVGDLGENWSFRRLNQAFRQLMGDRRPPLVALGMSRYFRAEDGLRLDAAPFVMALAHASGVEPTVLGKPAAAFFQAGLDALGVSSETAVMIGDDLITDIGGAQAAGIRGILVRTGKYQGEDATDDIAPYAVLDSFADLPVWWQEHGRSPTSVRTD